jgi:hypothetical protein
VVEEAAVRKDVERETKAVRDAAIPPTVRLGKGTRGGGGNLHRFPRGVRTGHLSQEALLRFTASW